MKQRTKPRDRQRQQRKPQSHGKREKHAGRANPNPPTPRHAEDHGAIKRFRLKKDSRRPGVYNIEYDHWICAPLEVVAHTLSAGHEANWGVLLRFIDRKGAPREVLLPMSAFSEKKWASTFDKLLDSGLRVAQTKNAPQELRAYIHETDQEINPPPLIRTVQRMGWYQDNGAFAFVLPNETIGQTNGEAIRMQAAHEQSHLFRTAGSLDDWRKNLAYYCQGNSLLAFAVCCAFGAPLLPFSGQQGGGFLLLATSTTGKTTVLRVAGSVWGGGSDLGFCQTCNSTMNGLENTAEAHNHCLLLLDELKMIKPEEASDMVYRLAGGRRKTRQNQEGHTQREAEWQLIFLISGELTLNEHTNTQRSHGGQAVRLCEIQAKIHEEHGSFEKLYSFGNAKAFSEYLTQQTLECYGTAGRAFVEKLAELGWDRAFAKVKSLISEFQRVHVPSGLNPEIARTADRFAAMAAGGELATEFGITGWIPKTAMISVAAHFDRWRSNRGTDRWDEQEALAHIRSVLLTQDSRLEYYHEPWNAKQAKSHQAIQNRLGFKTHSKKSNNPEIEFVFPKPMFIELCRPHSSDLTFEALKKKNLLVLEKNGNKAFRKPPELPRTGYVVISAHIFDDEQQSALNFSSE